MGWHIDEEGQTRHGGAYRDALEAADQHGVHLAERALIDTSGIDEAVAEHPFTGKQRRPDGLAHVIIARGGEEDRFRFRSKRFGDAGEKDMADYLSPGRAPRLAREHDPDVQMFKVLGEQRRMGRLAAAFAALEGDETSAHLALFRLDKKLIAARPRRGIAQSPFRLRHQWRAGKDFLWPRFRRLSAALEGPAFRPATTSTPRA